MKLRFFCDGCGTEVPRNTIRCPQCGRYFTAIQCPRCGFQGEERDFLSGCPSCGYMRVRRGEASPPAAADPGAGGGPVRKDRRRPGRGPRHRRLEQQWVGPSAPPSLYWAIGIALSVILLGLLVLLLLR
jgi:hypothetical protein